MNYISRDQEHILSEGINSPFVTAILGPRRVGKSTFLDHYVSQHPLETWVRFNMDSLSERSRVNNNELHQMIEEKCLRRIGSGSKIFVTIDEVQKCPLIFEQIKMLYDTHKSTDAIKFILTGSAHLDLHLKSAESLAGRIYYFYLREFSLREQLLIMNNHIELPNQHLLDCCEHESPVLALREYIQEISPLKQLLTLTLEREMCWGGLPEIFSLNSENEKYQYTSAYIQTYLENDVRAIESITDLTLYQRMLQVYAEMTGSLREDTKILQALGCARNTLIKYTQFMETTLMLKELSPFIYSTIKRITKSPKIYLLNNGMISYLSGIDELSILTKTGLIGHRLENWFLKELQLWNDRCPKNTNIHYWRLASGAEIDFIVKRGTRIFPFEITQDSMPNHKKIRNLITFLHETSDCHYAYYLYRGDFQVDEKNRIIFLPVWAVI